MWNMNRKIQVKQTAYFQSQKSISNVQNNMQIYGGHNLIFFKTSHSPAGIREQTERFSSE